LRNCWERKHRQTRQSKIEVRERLLKFLREHQVLTLAVMEADGSPHAAALFYAVDEKLRLYAVTDPATRHGKAMLANPSVAGTIQRDRQQWREIRGVQFRGICQQLESTERMQAWEFYSARFPFLREPNAILTREVANTALWRIDTTWIRLIDNQIGFGHKEEWTPPAAHGQ
jgi:uncharacterized protein YhbP (UPF0306 family)